MISLFRLLVLFQFLSIFMWIGLGFYDHQYGPENWKIARQYDGDGDVFTKWTQQIELSFENQIITLSFLIGVIIILIAFDIYAHLGLFFFWKFSREFYILSLIFGLITSFYVGISVSYPYEQFLMAISSTVSGVLLVLIFVPSIQEKFHHRKLFGKYGFTIS